MDIFTVTGTGRKNNRKNEAGEVRNSMKDGGIAEGKIMT